MINKLRDRALKMAEECECEDGTIYKRTGAIAGVVADKQRCPLCASYRGLARELEDRMEYPKGTWSILFNIPYIRSVLERLGLWEEFIEDVYDTLVSILIQQITISYSGVDMEPQPENRVFWFGQKTNHLDIVLHPN